LPLPSPPFPSYASFFVWYRVNGVNVGYAKKGLNDTIYVGVAARTIPPVLVEQLATLGWMIIPVEIYSQKLMKVNKDA
jgi:protein-L-isoaspartate O-methyltransferase